jgi:hypothetical protein
MQVAGAVSMRPARKELVVAPLSMAGLEPLE